MPIIEIKAIDTLFFRDGKPFSLGEETWADGIFPPSPKSFYGALRTKYFSENPQDFAKAGTDEDPTKNLKILGFSLKLDDYLQYPLPFDLHSEKKSEENKTYLLTLGDKKLENLDFWDNHPFSKILISSKDQKDKVLEPVENGFFTKLNLENYLTGKKKEFFYYDLSKFFVREPKIGIGRDENSKTSAEGKLYRVSLIRPESKLKKGERFKISFLVYYEGLDLPQEGFLKL
ncbi:MAG: hypothetical protein N3A69_13160, partial [Leptospiraceae bacterium]|nr:hypothetical protein [Leptospiraceae bacterium]